MKKPRITRFRYRLLKSGKFSIYHAGRHLATVRRMADAETFCHAYVGQDRDYTLKPI